ncbi:hypothetical protein [Sphingomonas hengshuiensis]|uniref:hypothetical protein n=1 Tax=Sphingomonas hengshuiensis TaxID=1609977 RepID=UPI000B2BBDE2|nr:hypothetical protein [Sphingomonas hengshuiensis]
MIARPLALLSALSLAPLAMAQHADSLWSYSYQNGIGEYAAGEWDRPTGAALLLSCRADGTIALGTQIKGKAPPPGTALQLAASTREETRESAFATDDTRRATAAAQSAEVRALWTNLRWGDVVTLRYADGRSAVLSLAGAAKTLPATPCA